MFCTECGRELHEGDRFCANCGTKVREIIAPAYQEVVFNPPFKTEAERRTAALSREVEESTEEPKVVRTEAPSFNWNLDGFPTAEPKKTEDVDFHWESVVERRGRERTEEPMSWSVLDAKPEATSATSAPVVDKIEIHGEERIDRDVKKMETAGAPETVGASEHVRAAEVPAAAEAPAPDKGEEERHQEQVLSAVQLEEELFGKEYRPLSSQDSDGIKNTSQLEKFYTYNEKKEAFQELLDKEYERLRAMEEGRRPDTASLEYTWASNLFPESRISDRQKEPAQDPAPVKEPEQEPEKGQDSASTQPSAAREAATIDFSAVREEARKKQQGRGDEALAMAAAAAVAGGAAISTDENTDPAEAPAEVPAATESPVETEEPAEAPAATESPAETEELAEVPAAEEPAAGEPEKEQSTPSPAEEEHARKAKLRYSDIFPRESVADAGSDNAADGGEASVPDGEQQEGEKEASEGTDKTVAPADPGGQGAPVSVRKSGAETALLFDDDDDEEEPPKMNIFLKLIIILLILLIVVEGLIIAMKFIAPDSAFSKKSSAVIETIMDKLTGGNGEDDSEAMANSDGDTAGIDQNTYISDILAGLAPANTIGQVTEDPSLKYDLTKTYAFKGVSKSAEFIDSDFKTGEDGNSTTYAEELISALVEHYDQWKSTNKDTSLIGINKLEIGEIRTGQKGYFVLCRLTYAGEGGQEVVRIESSYVKLSDDSDSMVINETREETL